MTTHSDQLLASSSLKEESTVTLTVFVKTFYENVAAIKIFRYREHFWFLFYIRARVLHIETKRFYQASILQSKILDNLLDFVSQLLWKKRN